MTCSNTHLIMILYSHAESIHQDSEENRALEVFAVHHLLHSSSGCRAPPSDGPLPVSYTHLTLPTNRVV